MFHLDVSKVDVGIAHVAMAIHVCFKHFIFFQMYVAMFYLDASLESRVVPNHEGSFNLV
jgi:hypothetical protein